MARRLCLEAFAGDIDRLDVSRIVLERCDGEQHRDHQVLDQAKKALSDPAAFSYDHADRRAEPLLWPADWVTWAWSKGGDWRRRVESVVGSVTPV